MRLTRDGIKDCTAWEQAGIALPGYDVEAVSEKAKEEPGWVQYFPRFHRRHRRRTFRGRRSGPRHYLRGNV